ncbi:MAG: UPF0182 family protein [Firmicutes bacterium]|nr:UPF0182 family protein [Bacillota bacterium]
MAKSLKVLITTIILILLVFLIFLFTGSDIYTDWLWFDNLGFAHTFTTMFFTNLWLRLLVGIIFTIFIYINLTITRKPFIKYTNVKQDESVESSFEEKTNSFTEWLNRKRLNYLFLLGSILLGFLFSSISQDLWKIVLNYFNQTNFGNFDPIFGKDISFYVFSLPFFNFIREIGMILVVLTFIVVGIIYTLSSGINSFKEMGLKLSSRAKGHLTLLFVFFLFLKAWSYRLNMYNLLYSPRGVAFGASYTDINANLLGLRILFYIALIVGVLLLVNLFKKSYKIIIWGLGIWIVTSLIFGSIYPGFVQHFQVEPNEIAKESKYINHNIDMTLKAYGLDDITTTEFKLAEGLNRDILDENQATLKNIRLWDPRPLRSTYRQLQGLRPYYSFANVDIDRYMVDGEYRQVMLSAREVDQNKLAAQAQNWINQTLKYTHGYGFVMSPTNSVTPEGLPDFFIKDIPTKSQIDIKTGNPRVYYGEMTNNYVIVNNKEQEFDYPVGSENAYYNYEGSGGVQIKNIFRKMIYALRYSNMKLLLANDISVDSRILYYRNIKERVRTVAPFLRYDSDPYLVTAEGRLFWIQDAYTTTDRYPYSQPLDNIGNYIRNSVKVVIDAFNGSMTYYVIDQSDPLAMTYQKIFPDLFTSGDQMPGVFRRHMRYPEDLFQIQSRIYTTYHMQDPTVFYNKEDIWNIPNENYAGTSITMDPYYIILELPSGEGPEFVQMLPFTPSNKNNMVAWMAGRSDGEKYGELLVYTFPKDQLIYGPMQIESRIDQNPDISQLLSLWSQRGSNVIRGNLLVIPIGEAILYVEPVYLQAENSQLPELKRVILAYKDRIVMRERFDDALNAIFGESIETIEGDIEDHITEPDVSLANVEELTEEAMKEYREGLNSIKEGDWAGYGEHFGRLQELLESLQSLSQ